MKNFQLINNKLRKLLFGLCIVLSAILFVASTVVSMRFGTAMLPVEHIMLPVSSLNGCMQALMALIGIIMVLIDRKKGLVTACIFMGLSLAGAVRAIIVSGNLSSAPGAFNALIFILAIIMISGQIKYSNEMAVTDSVTGLLNRYGFDRVLRRKLWQNEKGCIVFIHVDGFGPVNSNLGRRYGEELMTVVANRIENVIPAKCSAYKIEGSEYAIMMPESVAPDDIINKVMATIKQPITINKEGISSNCYLGAYVGAAEYGGSVDDVDTVLKHADIAMNYARKSGKNTFFMFDDAMKESLQRQVVVERLVKDSLKNGWFYLVYQPQYTVSDKRLRGFETLIRMNVPGEEKVPPSEFISIAELSDLVLEIDQYVLDRSMRELREICYSSSNTITLAVNISAKDIARAGFADKVLEVVARNEFPPECLEIEITEYSFAEEGNHTIENIKILRDNQIMIALDDFGTGYTSLGQLMNLPINLVKIDKSLIDNLIRNEMNMDFVKSIIYMGHLMDAEVIAEGVEHDNQVECLRNLDCDFIQGYIWGRPMEYDEARELAYDAYA